jgi:hypothetical protein
MNCNEHPSFFFKFSSAAKHAEYLFSNACSVLIGWFFWWVVLAWSWSWHFKQSGCRQWNLIGTTIICRCHPLSHSSVVWVSSQFPFAVLKFPFVYTLSLEMKTFLKCLFFQCVIFHFNLVLMGGFDNHKHVKLHTWDKYARKFHTSTFYVIHSFGNRLWNWMTHVIMLLSPTNLCL